MVVEALPEITGPAEMSVHVTRPAGRAGDRRPAPAAGGRATG